jgi:hypothetical protein
LSKVLSASIGVSLFHWKAKLVLIVVLRLSIGKSPGRRSVSILFALFLYLSVLGRRKYPVLFFVPLAEPRFWQEKVWIAARVITTGVVLNLVGRHFGFNLFLAGDHFRFRSKYCLSSQVSGRRKCELLTRYSIPELP